MIYASAWNKIMADLKADTILSKVYFKDNKGNLLYQTLEPTEHGVTLKGYSKGSYVYMEKKLAQMMDIVNAAGTGLGRGVHFVLRDNDDMKATRTFALLSSQIFFNSDVDWVFRTLHSTPWLQSYIPKTVYKHVDVYCDAG